MICDEILQLTLPPITLLCEFIYILLFANAIL